tara:strand:- start:1197 stop:1583 length:387 start_codon:yes stop_codon:yes gene_type:complete
MAHFAEIDDSNIVLRVLVLDNQKTRNKSKKEVESIGVKYLKNGFGGDWKRTSYNTVGGVHELGGVPFRKNFAGKGYTFDKSRDAFIPPKPFPSWTLNENTCLWDSPKPYPDDGGKYAWNENKKSWKKL